MGKVRVIDLAHPISEDMPIEIGQIRFVKDYDYQDRGFRSHWIQMHLHQGTHMDAPMHTEPGGKGIDEFDPGELYGDAVVLDFSGKRENEAITVEDVKEAESRLQTGIRPGDFVLLRTGWSKKWGTPAYWPRSPFLKGEAAQYLIQEKKVRGLGYDFSQEEQARDHSKIRSIAAEEETDPGALMKVHHAVLGAGRYHVEALTNLDAIQQERVKLLVAPLQLCGLEASFCRVLAIEEEE